LHMLCIEGALVFIPLTLAPGESWAGRQSFTLQAS
jgi:glucose-6-phosphate 1-epimerase